MGGPPADHRWSERPSFVFHPKEARQLVLYHEHNGVSAGKHPLSFFTAVLEARKAFELMRGAIGVAFFGRDISDCRSSSP